MKITNNFIHMHNYNGAESKGSIARRRF